ncbi:MAG: glycoside hydrolase family protein [Parvularculaceae bacterium]|nr:glycoside hydrolase family protein [Parvularculaceae bacterium]
MKISEAGIDLIKRFEGLELESYQDIAGVWTIGYGHTETAGPNQKINEREAEELLRRDIAPRERAVEQLAGVSLNQNEFDALVSFVFNVGAGAFKNSTARKRLNRNDRLGAAEALTWWNKATVGGVLREVRGLTRRRAAERALFLTPVNPPIVNKPEDIAENSRVTPVEEAPRRENLGDSRTIQGAAVAGGAGAAASTIGKDSAEELDHIETNIEQGTGLTEKPADQGGLGGDTPGAPNAGGDIGDGSSDDGTSDAPDASADGASDGGVTPDDGGTDGAAADSGTDGGDAPVTNPENPDAPTAGDATIQSIEMGQERPSKHEKHAVDAQLQFALLVIIVLSALYIVFARIDDWWKYRR